MQSIEELAVANFVPKLDAAHMTLTAPVLNAGREILFLVGGPGKAETIEAVLDGPEIPTILPAQMIRSVHPTALSVGSLMRMLAQNSVATRRKRTRLSVCASLQRPPAELV